ncbi:hypothetical protein [Halobacillus sp. BBL2006]|uniref:hypothetical protein n=1 Tax=Halobacillus sp. BBL2006 TaxID=1543706 RepID=UPI00054308E9|nr:hypothetical protein [Halobacillus sp. BBL2006]KHE72523.1 hypothetical protein LD39_04075 [Halobacillus sp. BBL2006]
MTYRIVGVDEQHIVIEFWKNNEEITFEKYEEAEKYRRYILSKAVIPRKYELEIIPIEEMALS